MKRTVVSSVALAAMFAGLQGFAQVRQDRPQREGQPRPGQTQASHEGSVESKLAYWLATCNNMQIEVSQLAAQKASDPAVKQYAQQMVEEHGQLNTQLAQFVSESDRDHLRTAGAANRGRTQDQPQTERDLERNSQLQQREPRASERQETRIGQAGGGQDPFQQIASEAARKSTQMITSLLEEKEGREFDMCYSGLQVFAHINFVSELEAMQGHGSEQFQQVVARAAQATESHLERAKQLAEKVGESAGGPERVTQRPERQGEQQERP